MTGDTPRYCTECGTQYLPAAAFCHNCGRPVNSRGASAAVSTGLSPALKWGVPGLAITALVVLTLFRMGARDVSPSSGAMPLSSAGAGAPDISAMSPTERADRLFTRVMRYWTEGKADSAAFFAPMALAAFEAVTPMTAHIRYDLGLVALVAGDIERASAQSDTILAGRPNHLLGLALAIRVADARGDVTAAKAARTKLVSFDNAERASGLPEYSDHDADLRAAVEAAATR